MPARMAAHSAQIRDPRISSIGGCLLASRRGSKMKATPRVARSTWRSEVRDGRTAGKRVVVIRSSAASAHVEATIARLHAGLPRPTQATCTVVMAPASCAATPHRVSLGESRNRNKVYARLNVQIRNNAETRPSRDPRLVADIVPHDSPAMAATGPVMIRPARGPRLDLENRIVPMRPKTNPNIPPKHPLFEASKSMCGSAAAFDSLLIALRPVPLKSAWARRNQYTSSLEPLQLERPKASVRLSLKSQSTCL